MPIEVPSGPSQPKSIEPSAAPSGAEEIKPLERKVEKAAENIGVLPEASPPLLTQREITELPVPLSKEISPEKVREVFTSIMQRKGISASADIGIEAIAARRFNEEVNVLLEIGGYPSLCPEYDVQSVHGKVFPKVDLIFTEAGVTITGITSDQLSTFLGELSTTHPSLQEQLTAFVHDGKVAVVPKEMVEGTEQIADDRFSEIATELRDRLVETKEADESGEALEESSAHKGGTETEISEEEVPETQQEEETPAVEKETVGHHLAGHITRNSVEAALVDKVAEGVFLGLVEAGIWNSQKKAEHHIQEMRAKEKLEQEEVQKEELKKKEQQKRIREEEEAHYEREREIEKTDGQDAALTAKGISREKGKQEETLSIGKYQEQKKAGEPSPPPSVPRT